MTSTQGETEDSADCNAFLKGKELQDGKDDLKDGEKKVADAEKKIKKAKKKEF